jgi:hypothetical protein
MRLVLVGLFLVLSSLLYAQPGGGGPGGGGDPDVPLGGIELLIAAGALFGARKWFDKSKKD